MHDIKRIIVPIDRSDASRIATEQGAKLAKSLGVEIVVLSVDDSQQFMASGILENKLQKEHELILEEFKKIVESKEVPVHIEIVKGLNPAHEIIKFSNDDDLILMASHNKKGLDRLVLGSVSEEVLRTASCPVLIIKPDLSEENLF
jgi:nucleotide-binding universal stress UspA family protein